MSYEKQQRKIEEIREYVLKSGFPSEIEIGNILRKNGWIVGNQWPYIDKESSKIRAVDVYAMKLGLQPPGLGVSLLIECKKSIKHDWVFHTQKKEGEFLPGLWTVIDFLKKLSKPPLSDKLKALMANANLYSLLGLQHPSLVALDKLAGLHVLDKTIKLGVLNVIPSSKDDFFEATQQIISALESMSEGMKQIIIFPVIVFDGEIFEFYQENGKIQILPTNHLQFMTFEKARANVLPCLIDVIRKTYFSEYVRIIERDFTILNEVLKFKSA